jgi:hypothetical protein
MVIAGGHLLGLYRFTADELLDIPMLALFGVAIVGILSGILVNSGERRWARWVLVAAWTAMWGSLQLTRAFDDPGWPRSIVLMTWTVYVVLVSSLALRWFLGARKAAWSQVAAQP